MVPVLCSQPAGDVSHKPDGRLPLLSARPAVTIATLGCYQFGCLVNRGTMGVNSLPKTVTRQRRGCDLNPGPSAPESSTLTTRLSIGGGVIRQKQSVCCICNDVGWAEYRAAADLRKQIVIRCSFQQHESSRPATLNAARCCGYKFTQHQLNVSCSNRCKGSETRRG